MWELVIIGLLTPALGLAQSSSQLRSLLQLAPVHSPALTSRAFEAQALAKQTAVLRASRLPTLDATAQANLATYNNLTGMYYPTGMLPISGPPSPGNTFSPVPSTGAALLLNWSPFTFGAIDSRISVAQAELAVKLAQHADESLRVQVTTAQAYLDQLLTDELAQLAERNRVRVDSLLQQVQALVQQGLRSEVDTALVITELSRARIDAIQAQQRSQDAQVKLAGQLARLDTVFALTDTFLLVQVPRIPTSATEGEHPVEQIFSRQIDLESARMTQIRRQYLPRLSFWATGYARGSGIDYKGVVNGWDGLTPSRYNYGAGAHLLLPLLRNAERNALLTQQDSRLKAAQEQFAQTRLTLQTQQRSAELLRHQAEVVASQMPRQVRAARQALLGLQNRYASGLISLFDVIQAQYALLRAESEQKATILAVWRGLLLEAYARGDIRYFLQALP